MAQEVSNPYSTDKEVSFDPAKDIPSLNGKVIFITGANTVSTGLGKQTALELAKHNPAQIWMTARSTEKGQAAVDQVKQQSPDVDIRFLQLDMASFGSIKNAANHFLSSVDRLDILYLNAGIMGHPPDLTEDEYEIHIGINHLGHALLLKLFVPLLSKTAFQSSKVDVRVVSLASIGHKHVTRGGVDFDHLKEADVKEIAPVERYTQSKLANLLYAREAAAHYTGFTVVSLDPGPVQTELFAREPSDAFMKHLQTEIAPKHWGPVEDGVKNQLWAGTAHGVRSGVYYESVGVDAATGVGKDDKMAKRLWDWTEEELEGHSI